MIIVVSPEDDINLEAFERDGVKKYFNSKQPEDKRTKLQRYVHGEQYKEPTCFGL